MNWLKACLSKAKGWIVERWKPTLIVIGIGLVPFILWKVPEWQVRAYHGRLDAGAVSQLKPLELLQLQKDLITAENNARMTLAQIIGGLVMLLGLYATFKNVWVAEEGKLTERFSKAVELLGSDKLDIRLGGIYALERIARDSQKDHWTVMEVLTAFVRENSPLVPKKMEPKTTNAQESEDTGADKPVVRLREDIHAALTVIGRRKWVKQEKPGQVINFRSLFLYEASLGGASLSKANLFNADLSEADLSEADLGNATLTIATLTMANLTGADVFSADLTLAILCSADLSGVDLSWTTLRGANLRSTNLRNVKDRVPLVSRRAFEKKVLMS